MKKISRENIVAIVVSYEPAPQVLSANVDRIAAQVARVHVLDNSVSETGQAAVRALQDGNVEVTTLAGNIGIAAALNRGVAWADAMGADFALLLDQDSTAGPDMVRALVAGLRDAEEQLPPVAAIGPTQVDERTGAHAPFVRFGFPLNKKYRPAPGQCVACDFLITSGTLLDLAAHKQIGPFDERLFIDNVDMEWSHRAIAAGFRLLGSADAKMTHRLGDRLARRPGGHAAIHEPFRLYYMMRNRVHLYFRKRTPVLWVAQDLPRLLLKFVGFSLFVHPRSANARAMLQGIADGVTGRLGVRSGSEKRERSGDKLA